MAHTTKTEHNGPKRRGGAWMPKADAKRLSNRLRRAADRAANKEVN